MATAEIPFDGKKLNLYGLQKYFEQGITLGAVKG